MQGKQKMGSKIQKLGSKNGEERQKLADQQFCQKPKKSSKTKKLPKDGLPVIQKKKRAETNSKKSTGKKVKCESKKRERSSDRLQSLKRHIVGDWDRRCGLFDFQQESLKPKITTPSKLVGASTKCSFKVALVQNDRRFRRPPKIVDSISQEKLLTSTCNFFGLQSMQDGCYKAQNETRHSENSKQSNLVKEHFKSEDLISQNEGKNSPLQEKSKQLFLGEPKSDGLFEKGINDIEISLSEMNSILREIKNSKTGKKNVSLTDFLETISEESDEDLDSFSGTDKDSTRVQSNESLRANVNSEIKTLFKKDAKKSSDLIEDAARGDAIYWKLAHRKEDDLISQMDLIAQKEDKVSKLQSKLREMTEDLQNTWQNRIAYSFQNKRLLHVYEDKLRELYTHCKLAEEEMHSLRAEREELVYVLREQTGEQTHDIHLAYQQVLREKEAMKLEMKSLFGFLIEQGKSMDNLRVTVKTLTEQLDKMRQEFQEQNNKLSAYHEKTFNEFNNDCKNLQKQILRKGASLALLSSCEIETFSCRSISPI